MIKRIYAYLALLIALAAFQNVSGQESTNDKAEIKQMLSDYVDAVNRHDPKTMASFWEEDGDLINAWGELATSRQDVENTFTKNIQGKLKNSKVVESIEYIRRINPEVALVDVDRVITGVVDDKGQKNPRLTLTHHAIYVLVKKDGKWKIVSSRVYKSPEPLKES